MRLAAGTLLLALLGGCTAVRIAYNNADTLVRYMATDYVDFEPGQNDAFKARLTRFHEWHRTQELPGYVALLAEARRRVARGLAEEDVDWALTELHQRYQRLAAQAAAEAAPLLLTLSPSQIADMERKLAEGNAKFAREHHFDDTGRRIRKHARQMRGRFEDWMGGLSEGQEERIDRFVRDHDGLVLLRYEERQRRQREGVALIRGERDPAVLARRLTALFVQPADGKSAGYGAALARYEQALARLVLDIDRSASPQQRERTARRMERYADDFVVLSGRNAVATAP
jgi:hypothetical protein